MADEPNNLFDLTGMAAGTNCYLQFVWWLKNVVPRIGIDKTLAIVRTECGLHGRTPEDSLVEMAELAALVVWLQEIGKRSAEAKAATLGTLATVTPAQGGAE